MCRNNYEALIHYVWCFPLLTRKIKTVKQYIVDAFTNEPFKGNPAAVCVMDEWPNDEWMQKLAAENRLSETAYIVYEPAGWRLRWFTPSVEVELCGHATLASAFVVFNFYDTDATSVKFQTQSGELTVKRLDNDFVMDFPRHELSTIPVTDAMEQAFGVRPIEAVLGLDLVCVFESEDVIRDMAPDQEILLSLPGRIQNVTAAGIAYDCVSRSFCPKLGIAEDPVCGSAHCQIADYWACRLDKDEINAYQASPRSGALSCHLVNKNRIAIGGTATLISTAELAIFPY